MTNHHSIRTCLVLLIGLFCLPVLAADQRITATIRLTTAGNMVFRVTNVGDTPFPTFPPDYGNNTVHILLPNGKTWQNRIGKLFSPRMLSLGAVREDSWPLASFAHDQSGLDAEKASGLYLFRWVIDGLYESPELPVVVLGKEVTADAPLLNAAGPLFPIIAHADPAKPRFMLAFVLRDEAAPELGFLVANGTQKAVPLSSNSVIVASAPAIKYTRKLALPKTPIEATAVASGKVAEWRLPWQTVLDLMPKEDLAKIEAAGGDLDLVWKVGEFESLILPLSLGRPDEGK